MKTVSLLIEITSFWHIGSGHGRGGDVDAVVLRDATGLPYLPGKTLKGLIREAAQIAEDNGGLPVGTVVKWFGNEMDEKAGSPEILGKLAFDNARIPERDRKVLVSDPGLRSGLFLSMASTRIDSDTGTAKDNTLRRKEVVMPLNLEAWIHGPEDDSWVDDLQTALPLVRMLGVNRHRGLGRCIMSIQTEAN